MQEPARENTRLVLQNLFLVYSILILILILPTSIKLDRIRPEVTTRPTLLESRLSAMSNKYLNSEHTVQDVIREVLSIKYIGMLT